MFYKIFRFRFTFPIENSFYFAPNICLNISESDGDASLLWIANNNSATWQQSPNGIFWEHTIGKFVILSFLNADADLRSLFASFLLKNRYLVRVPLFLFLLLDRMNIWMELNLFFCYKYFSGSVIRHSSQADLDKQAGNFTFFIFEPLLE